MSGLELASIADEEKELRERREPQVDVVIVSPSRGGLITDPNGPPVDRYQLVFIILLIHGIGTLMPWNMFINAQDYFRNYKLRPSDVDAKDIHRDLTDAELVELRKNFLSYLSLAAQLPNALFNGLNLVVNLGSGNLRLRVNVTLAVEAAIFVLTIVLAVVNSYSWPGSFFHITMISVVLLNMASGIYQNCVFGIGAKFPGKYTNAILIGSNLSGTFTSIVNLLSIWLAPEPQEAAMYYFITALFIILICLVSYNLINLNPFFRHYDKAGSSQASTNNRDKLEIATTDSASLRRIREEAGKQQDASPGAPSGGGGGSSAEGASEEIPDILRAAVDAMVPRPDEERPVDNSFMGELMSKWFVFKKCWPQCLNVFFTFFITLALFPSVMASIKQSGSYFSEKYFAAFACFFLFNLFAMIGNLISGWTTWPGRERVWILVAARVLFIPFFLFCNFNPDSRHWPVLIHSDISYMLGNILLALSSGYLSSLCMMFASSNLKPDEAPKGGMLAAFFLVFGIFIGINSSFILTAIVETGAPRGKN